MTCEKSEGFPGLSCVDDAYQRLLAYSKELRKQNLILQQLLKGATLTIRQGNQSSDVSFSMLTDTPELPDGLFTDLPTRTDSSCSPVDSVTAIPRLATVASPADLPLIRKKLSLAQCLDDSSAKTDSDKPKFYKSDLMPILEERNHWKEKANALQEELDEWKRAAVKAQDQLEELENALSRRSQSGVSELGISAKGINFKPRVHHEPKQVYVSDVEVLGHSKINNKFVFAIQTTWCDRKRFEIYRRYAEFFMFQNTLLSLFPVEGGKHRASEKIIPTLPTADNILCLIGGITSKSAVESRLKLVNDYCVALLISLPPKISRSQYVLDFFKPVPGDKQLEMLQKPRGNTLELSVYPLMGQGSTSSFITEQCVAISDFTADKTMGNQLSLAAREVVMVIKNNDHGWCYVAKVESPSECGWVPSAFLKKTSEDELLKSASINNLGFVSSVALDLQEIDPALKYVAIDSYETSDSRQICFPEGAILVVVEKSEDGWWFATYNGESGWVPSSYLEPACQTEKAKNDVEESIQPSILGQKYVTCKSYTAQADDEISLPCGVSVEVIEKTMTGWWTVRYKKRTGCAPAALLALPDDSFTTNNGSDLQSTTLTHSVSGIRKPPPRRRSVLEMIGKRRALTTMDSINEPEEFVAVPVTADQMGAVLENAESPGRGERRGIREGIMFSPKHGWDWFSQQLGRGMSTSKKVTSKLDSPPEKRVAQEKRSRPKDLAFQTMSRNMLKD